MDNYHIKEYKSSKKLSHLLNSNCIPVEDRTIKGIITFIGNIEANLPKLDYTLGNGWYVRDVIIRNGLEDRFTLIKYEENQEVERETLKLGKNYRNNPLKIEQGNYMRSVDGLIDRSVLTEVQKVLYKKGVNL